MEVLNNKHLVDKKACRDLFIGTHFILVKIHLGIDLNDHKTSYLWGEVIINLNQDLED